MNKIKLLQKLPENKIVSCKVCGSKMFERWLETVGGQTGIYCSCGRRLSLGIPVDYQIAKRKN